MDYLTQANRRCLGDELDSVQEITADGKHVIIIGGGDTGADCLGTAHRQRAKSVRQFQIHEMPPDQRSPKTPWPMWPIMLRSEGAHEEGGIREWNVRTTGFTSDEDGHVRKLHGVRLGPGPDFAPVEGGEFTLDADLVLIAIGFGGAVREGLLEQLPLELGPRGAVVADETSFMTSSPGFSWPAICAAGSRWWSGRSRRAARPPLRSTAIWSASAPSIGTRVWSQRCSSRPRPIDEAWSSSFVLYNPTSTAGEMAEWLKAAVC